MPDSVGRDDALMTLAEAISSHDTPRALRLLADAPDLAQASLTTDATFDRPRASYVGDTALHIAAAVHDPELIEALVSRHANVRARNRRGAEPLHYAAVGQPGLPVWNPTAQAEAIRRLIQAGADPNATDKSGVTPLHRAVRTRSAMAVTALLDMGANIQARNNNGSTALLLAKYNTGRSGSGSAEAKLQQREILDLLERRMR